MAKHDVIDEETARRFAWRTTAPEAAEPEPPPAPKAPAPPPTPQEDEQRLHAQQERWARARRAAAALAADVSRAWQTTPRVQQAAATASLLQRAKRIGADVFLLSDHPVETLRLWRLAVRHLRRLPVRGQNEHVFALTFLSPPLDEPEMADLLAEVAAAGSTTLVLIMNNYLEREGTRRRHPEIGARLARIVAEGRTWAAREAAAGWLTAADLDVAGPALRRALRQPRLGLRSRALELLLQRTPPVLTEEDIVWLLDDAVAHTPPEAVGERAEKTVKRYAGALLEATAQVRPAAGFGPLARIADRGDPLLRNGLVGLDASWALRTLAAAYPERALGRIDRALLTHRWWLNFEAIEGVARMPLEMARPRLLEAAARARHRLAERAKAIWFERLGEACPVDPLDGVPVALLAEAPSQRFFACLTVLRGKSEEARQAMMEALLAEAPPCAEPPDDLTAAQREALSLLLFAARDDGPAHPRLPGNARAWAELLFARFGAPAFTGLAVLAERDARAGLDHQWIPALASLAKGRALAEPQRERLRDVARVGLASPAWDGAQGPMVALFEVGAPADLEGRLVSILTSSEADDFRGPYFGAAYLVEALLVRACDVPGLDERLVAAAAAARDARAWTAFQRLASTGCRRGAPAMLRLTEQVIAAYDGDPAAHLPMSWAGGALRDSAAADEAWLLDLLRRPASPAFGIAAMIAGEKPSLAALAALRDALDSTARDGSSAAEAAEELFAMSALGAEDRRLDGILERAPSPARSALMARLIMLEVPLSPFRRHVAELLASPDEDVAEPVLSALFHRKPEGMMELLEDALPFAACPSIRSAMEEALGEPSEETAYWQDGGAAEVDAAEDDAGDEPA